MSYYSGINLLLLLLKHLWEQGALSEHTITTVYLTRHKISLDGGFLLILKLLGKNVLKVTIALVNFFYFSG